MTQAVRLVPAGFLLALVLASSTLAAPVASADDAGQDEATTQDPHGWSAVSCTSGGGSYTAVGSGQIDGASSKELTVQVRALYDFPTGTFWVVLSSSSTTTPHPHWDHYETDTTASSQAGYYSWQGRAIMTGWRHGVQETYNAYDAC